MKPPPRKRNKKNLSIEPPSAPRKGSGTWQRLEQKKLLNALTELGKTNNVNEDIDCEFLRKHVRTRSISEISTMVELLKSQVISFATLELKKKMQEEKGRKPIEEWTRMASLVAGAQEETVSDAFSQMLTVCSTEPNTLRYSNPPQVYRPPPVGCTVPLRPVPHQPVKVEKFRTNTARPIRALKSPVAAMSRGVTPRPLSTAAGASPAPPPTSQSAPSERPPTTTTTSSSESPSSSPHTSPTNRAPAPSPAPSSGASSSTPVRQFHSKLTSKLALKCTPSVGAQSVVHFERIYHYLSIINSPGESCTLTAMESAIVLDLLMSLPEELPLLDCSKLKKHLLQVYRFLSSTADSKMAREMLKELKGGLCVQTDGTRTNGEQNAAGSADSSDVTDSGEKRLQPEEAESQSSGSNNATGQSGDLDLTGLCPPLNPFMVPLKLLQRK
ncbi:snRNA-activating protein complex subunit 2 isoform X2 [Gymnodraco acuticeps]|uniref:snRNA-activating protein complex subunit 2 isoform X2 n=1 Tax=Gymnodraco acuticeps TaxID=8218 RepID=A0A6P8U5X2_GYMAC|nr:snRNA-activating protein complex subunit 2 isoform X2 [Gymnodraco acuticeps]